MVKEDLKGKGPEKIVRSNRKEGMKKMRKMCVEVMCVCVCVCVCAIHLYLPKAVCVDKNWPAGPANEKYYNE